MAICIDFHIIYISFLLPLTPAHTTANVLLFEYLNFKNKSNVIL